MDDKQFIEAMELVVSSLKERGYDPYSQIYGYLMENDPVYITSRNHARELIQKLDKDKIKEYIDSL